MMTLVPSDSAPEATVRVQVNSSVSAVALAAPPVSDPISVMTGAVAVVELMAVAVTGMVVKSLAAT